LETLDNWLAMQEGRIGGQHPAKLLKKKLVTGVGIYHFLDQKLPFEDDNPRKKD
jgi:hypothetical protein